GREMAPTYRSQPEPDAKSGLRERPHRSAAAGRLLQARTVEALAGKADEPCGGLRALADVPNYTAIAPALCPSRSRVRPALRCGRCIGSRRNSDIPERRRGSQVPQ